MPTKHSSPEAASVEMQRRSENKINSPVTSDVADAGTGAVHTESARDAAAWKQFDMRSRMGKFALNGKCVLIVVGVVVLIVVAVAVMSASKSGNGGSGEASQPSVAPIPRPQQQDVLSTASVPPPGLLSTALATHSGAAPPSSTSILQSQKPILSDYNLIGKFVTPPAVVAVPPLPKTLPSDFHVVPPISADSSWGLDAAAVSEPSTMPAFQLSLRNFTRYLLTASSSGASSGDNVVISPLATWIALSMASVGACGQAREEMFRALFNQAGVDDNMNFWPDISALQTADKGGRRDPSSPVNDFNQEYPPVTLGLANSVWTRSAHVNPLFTAAVQKLYDAQSFPITNAADVNSWIANHTNNLIKNMVDDSLFTPRLLALLVSTVYMKAQWEGAPFSLIYEPRKFYTTPTQSAPCTMMDAGGNLLYFENNQIQATKLPLGHFGKFSAVIMLPKDNSSSAVSLLYSLVSPTTAYAQSFFGVVNRMQVRKGSVTLPKFSVQSPVEDFTHRLQSMGMHAPFQTGLAPPALCHVANDTDVFISNVLHQAVLKVDESGVEAAAAVMVMASGNGYDPSIPFEMNVNHPFLFFIVDNTNLDVLFAAAVQHL